MNIFEVTPNFGAGTQAIGALTSLPIAAYASPPGNVAQQGSGTGINTLGERFMFKLNYRNNGGTESVVITHTVGNGALAAVRWYELRRVAAVWTVFQQGTITGADGNSRWMGGISMDGCGNIALMYDKSGTTSFPSVVYTGRNASDPLNTMTLPEATIINGAAAHTNSRWGDYNSTVQDYTSVGNPNNGSFWTTSQYANQQTRIANFTLTGGCAAAPNITAGAATLTAEGCVANNGVIDPGETVTVSFCGLNVGTLNTTNLVGTMQVSGGVTPISGPQNYGVVVAGGAAVCRAFSFSNTSGTCGGTITVSIQWQDGATNLGTSTWTFTLGTTVISSSQNFDAVVAPALPAGWVATNVSGPAPLWVTRDNTSLLTPVPSLPNSLFIDNPAVVSDKQIVTPSFTPGAGARVSFANNYSLESGFDGGVLEISINGGAYQDILAAGGSFVAGGYTGSISASFANPLANRQAWTGTSGSFITTTVNMPPASAGQPCQLKFRMGSDNSVSATGWRVDNFSVSAPACCGAACTITCPANITVNTGPGAPSCGINVTFPAAVTTGLCGAVTYSPANGSFFPKGTTTVTASTAAGPSCTFTVTVVDNTVPTIVCPANITANNTPGLCSAPVTYALPTFNDNCPFGGGIPTTVTQNSSNTIVAGSVACNAGGLHTDNSYWRAFPLALSGPFTVNSVQFGIELANAAGVGTTQPVTVRVYTSAGAFPAGVRTLVASQTFNIPDQTLSLYTATFTTPPQVASNAILVLEIFTPSGQPAGHSFFIGSNAAAGNSSKLSLSTRLRCTQSGHCWFTWFPNMHIVLNAIGTVPNPAGAMTQIAGLPSGSVFPVGVTTNTFRVTDAVGLTAQCSFTVTVVDNQAPVVTCPPSVVRNTDPNVCTSTYATPNPTTSDNCGVTSISWVMTGATTGASPLTGINYLGTQAFGLTGTTGQGITTVTYTVKDAAGNTTTCSYTVTVNDASIPVISGQPTNQFVCVGSNGAFSVTATAGAGNPLTYQWQGWNGSAWVNIAGATNATLPLNAVTFSMNTNSYRVILTGRCSVVTSGFATLYVNRLPTVVLAASRIPILLPTESVNLVVTADPTGGTYQWYLNGSATPIPGVTGATYAGLTVDNIGTYTVKYTDLNGCVSTTNAITVSGAPSGNLYVYPNPNFGQFSVRFFNQAGESATITVYDAKGARVFQRQMVTTTAYTKLDVELGPTTNSGVYLVEVLNSTGKVMGSKRVIVRHP
ncbi:MAG: HYR domain-containing protein [Chitinophagaceae bacterium]|nr:HYR domain-containing protein [Chitinophagaceae bacterium]